MKKWNLYGPDGYNYYWRDLRKSPIHFSKRNFGGGSLMVCGAFTASGTLEIQFPSTKMKSSDYIAELQCSLLSFLEQNREIPYIFQQDNARIHVSKETKSFLSRCSVEIMEWPA